MHLNKLLIGRLKQTRFKKKLFNNQAAVAIICFCSFHLSCPIHENDNFIQNLYIVLSYFMK